MCSPHLIFNMVLSHRFVKTSFFFTSPVIVLQIPHIEYISASDSNHVQKMSEFSCSVLRTGRQTGCITALLVFVKKEAFIMQIMW